jgi:hypothetical protein
MDKPQAVWFNTQEDDHQMVLRPRLMVAGADPDKVTLTSEPWQFPRDLDAVREELQARSVDLLVLDSVQTHIPNFTATGPAAEAMQGLMGLVHELDLAVVLIHHFTKGGASSLRTSIGGAGVLQNLARGAIFIVGPKPLTTTDLAKQVSGVVDCHADGDTAGQEYVLAPVRCGIGSLPESLLFELQTKFYEGTLRDEAYFALTEPTSISADEVLRAIKASTGGKAGGSTKEQQALVWLLEVLAAQGLRPVVRLEEEARAVGITKRTLERARREAKSEGLIEVVRPEELSEVVGREEFEKLGDAERRAFWLMRIEDVGEPPVDEWAKEA